MAAVPVIITGVYYPKQKGSQAEPCVLVGYASIAGLEVGGGPVIPDNPPEVPVDPPPDQGAGVAVVIKPAPVTGGWGYSNQGWFYSPGQSGAGPKK